MVIAARTGQGKTLCFGIPILDLCVRQLEKIEEKGGEAAMQSVETGVRGLILSPTRELAI